MAFTLADRVYETSTTTGTGSYTLAGAVSGFRTYASAVGNNQCPYIATMGTQWECGIGTLSGSSLARTVLLSSSTGSLISWGVGTKEVRLDVPASVLMMLYQNAPRWAGTLGGSATAMTATLSPAIYSYWAGLTINAITGNFLDSATPTLNVNGIGAVNVKTWRNANLPTNVIGPNYLLTFVHDGSIFRVKTLQGE
jgi:hypothetical protein